MQTIFHFFKLYKSQIYTIFKWLSIPIVVIVLYYQLFIVSDAQQAWIVFQQSFALSRIWFLFLCLLLVPLNLGLEALKWQKLVSHLHSFSLSNSFRSLFAGIALSIFTPKRVGEYAGRIMLLNKNHKQAITAMFVGNLSQTLANLSLGLFTMLIFLSKFDIDYKNQTLLLILAVLICLCLAWIYFHLETMVIKFQHVSFFKKHLQFLDIIGRFDRTTLFQLLLYSTAKYIIFIIQFVLIIKALGVEISLFWGIICASSVFFIKTMLPVPASVELAARGSIAIYFFSFFSDNNIGILVASLLLWVVNLAIPAIIGSYFINRSKLIDHEEIIYS